MKEGTIQEEPLQQPQCPHVRPQHKCAVEKSCFSQFPSTTWHAGSIYAIQIHPIGAKAS